MRCPDIIRRPTPAVVWLVVVPLLLAVPVAGCGDSGPKTIVVRGTVTVGGEKVDTGEVRFVPIEGTPGSTCVGAILDGQYEIDARGGVPVGKHRVEVDARKKTGKKVKQYNGFEMTMVDETVRMGPEKYAGDGSPVVEEITSDSDGRIDIEIPAG